MIYEDRAVRARLLSEAAAVGHVEVVPQEEAQTLMGMGRDEAVQLFFAASFAATALFEAMGAHGTNIVVQEGEGVRADVYARVQDDGLGLRWDAQQADRGALEQTAKKVRDAFWYVGKDAEQPERLPVADTGEPESVEQPPARDYRVRQLRRSP